MTPKAADLLKEIKTIREAVESYECDDTEKKALTRIARSESALEALAEMQLTDAQLKKVIFSLIQAFQVTRDFRLMLAREVTMPARLEKLGKAVADLRKFVTEVSTRPQDLWSALIIVEAEDKRAYLRALYDIERLIKNREQIARETPRRIGATRKTSIKNAPKNAGIGWLAASIERICSRPYSRQTRRLAEVLFSIGEINADRLRHALQNHTKRNWRI